EVFSLYNFFTLPGRAGGCLCAKANNTNRAFTALSVADDLPPRRFGRSAKPISQDHAVQQLDGHAVLDGAVAETAVLANSPLFAVGCRLGHAGLAHVTDRL